MPEILNVWFVDRAKLAKPFKRERAASLSRLHCLH
jgi:hypothetical protein